MRNQIRFAFILSLALSAQLLHAQSYRETGAFALTNVRIEIGDGRVIEKGTVLLRDGMIQAVGKEVAIPAGTEIVKGDGMTVYPGFTDCLNSGGLMLPPFQPVQDVPPDTSAFAPPYMREANRKGVRPELRASEYFALNDGFLSPLRKEGGFTTAMILPSGGTIAGSGALINLSGKPKRESVLKNDTGIGFSFSSDGESGGGTGYPGSLLGIIAHLRQTLFDAQRYPLQLASYAKHGGPRPPVDDTLQALQPVLSGSQTVFFNASNENEVVRALNLSKEFHFKLFIAGGQEAYKQAPLLAKEGVPVIVSLNFGEDPAEKGKKKEDPPKDATKPADKNDKATEKPVDKSEPVKPVVKEDDPKKQDDAKPEVKKADDKKPDEKKPDAKKIEDELDEVAPKAVAAHLHEEWLKKVNNAAILSKSGVQIAFSSKDGKGAGEFWKGLRQAMKSGLPKQKALEALTINPAKMFHLEKSLGTIEVGKIANLVVMSGDFSDDKSKFKMLFIDKTKFDLEEEAPASAPVSRRRPREIE